MSSELKDKHKKLVSCPLFLTTSLNLIQIVCVSHTLQPNLRRIIFYTEQTPKFQMREMTRFTSLQQTVPRNLWTQFQSNSLVLPAIRV
jgi:hypothetical protein